LDPELHLNERCPHVFSVADDIGGEFRGCREFPAKLVAEEALVKALDGSQQRQFPLGILNHSRLLEIARNAKRAPPSLVKPKEKRSAIGYLVTEVMALVRRRVQGQQATLS